MGSGGSCPVSPLHPPQWVEGACLSVQHTLFLLIAPGRTGTSPPNLDSSKCWAARDSEPSPTLTPLVSRPRHLVQMGKLKPEKGKKSGHTASSPSSPSSAQLPGVNLGGSDLFREEKQVKDVMKLMTAQGSSDFTPGAALEASLGESSESMTPRWLSLGQPPQGRLAWTLPRTQRSPPPWQPRPSVAAQP